MERNKITVIFGPNGSGKTQYVERMRRQLASDSVRYLAFSDAYGPATDRAYYLQLRWNQHDIDAETPIIGTLLERVIAQQGEETEERRAFREHLYELFNMRPLLDKYVILLSSGELRKFQLIKALLSNPRILILDNPFIGLDAEARRQLNELLLTIATEQQTELWLVLSKRGDIPDYADEVLKIDQTTKDAVVASGKVKGIKDTVLEEAWQQRSELMAELTTPTANNTLSASPVVIDMHNVSIRYGERTILKDLDWRVMKGERWALGGQNGSGKSTLLSLVCADNPQSYACDIALFGQQRGTGESIWEIKKHIGYVSPEMHRSYLRDIKTVNVVASGLKDTVGLYMRPNDEEEELCRRWLSVFGIEQLADRSFITLSSGEQRLALVARAFVKNPDLLILDEPLHGLDDQNRRLVQHIINQFCEDKSKTLIMVTHYEEELPACIEKKLYLRRN